MIDQQSRAEDIRRFCHRRHSADDAQLMAEALEGLVEEDADGDVTSSIWESLQLDKE